MERKSMNRYGFMTRVRKVAQHKNRTQIKFLSPYSFFISDNQALMTLADVSLVLENPNVMHGKIEKLGLI